MCVANQLYLKTSLVSPPTIYDLPESRVYYSSLIFFFGAEFTHTWATRQHAVVPKPHAEPGAAPQHKSDADAQAARQHESEVAVRVTQID